MVLTVHFTCVWAVVCVCVCVCVCKKNQYTGYIVCGDLEKALQVVDTQMYSLLSASNVSWTATSPTSTEAVCVCALEINTGPREEAHQLRRCHWFKHTHTLTHPHIHTHTMIRSMLLASSMDGTHKLFEISGDPEEGQQPIVQKFSDHSKFVVRIRWSPNGRFFATASYDKTCRLYE